MKRKKNIIERKIKKRKWITKQKVKKLFFLDSQKLVKIFFILILIALFYKIKVAESFKNNDSSYFSCYSTMVKLEGKYIKDLVEHYLKLGFEKIIFGDDNSLNSENLSKILQYYIRKGKVDVIDIREKYLRQIDYFILSYNKYKSKCQWIAYFDIDEYLEFTDKKMTIHDYLSKDIFNKCEVIKVNWLMFFDNDNIFYDRRPLQERFPVPNYHNRDSNTVKSFIRGNLSKQVWENGGIHEPNAPLTRCDSVGNLVGNTGGLVRPAKLEMCYLKHYNFKSTEEYAYKLKKQLYNHSKFDWNTMLNYYFQYNKFTPEKLYILESILNTTFNQYHQK
jgi:hypothetical protein